MLRRNFLKNLGLFSAATTIPVGGLLASEKKLSGAALSISGYVKNKKGQPLPKVGVSDGFSVVQTDARGYYSLSAHPRSVFVFVSIPSGYAIPNKKGIAHFYEKLDKNATKQQVNFELEKLDMADDKHAFIVWADPQIQSPEDATQLKDVSAPDTKKEIALLAGQPLHGIGCGDLVFDHPELNADYKTAVETAGIPFFQLIGNHDEDYKSRSDEHSQDTFMSHYGPTNYSFNRGKIHYIMVDNVFFVGQGHRYIGYLSEDLLEWIGQDLATVPHGSPVIFSLHIPTNTGERRRTKAKEDSMGGITLNRQALYDLLAPYKVHFISGHTHWNETWEKDNMMEHNLGTLCGAWWTGPVCGDGTPSGYMVFQVEGEKLSWYYKATGHDKSYQLVVYKEGALPDKPNAILANVWNYDPSWKIEWWEDGQYKGEMKQITGYDPLAYDLYLGPKIPQKHKWVEPILTDHLFYGETASRDSKVTVKATDRFGNIYQSELVRG